MPASHRARMKTNVPTSPHGEPVTAVAVPALSRLGDSLRVPEGASVQHVLLYGDPGNELLGFATRVDADLIATGSNGHGRVTRMLIGSVAAHVLRHSTCSVLIVPHEAVAMRAWPLASRVADRDRGASSGKDG